MTSISSAMGGFGRAMMQSPDQRLQAMLQSSVSAGSISSTDQTALSSAIGDIDTSLQAGATSNTSATAGASSSSTTAATTDTSDTGSMQDKVDGLIDQEVSNGKLTSDQATELKGLFQKAAAQMAGGHHHMHGGPPPTSSADSDSSDDPLSLIDGTSATASTDGTSSTSTSSSGTDSVTTDLASAANSAISALTGFLDALKGAASSGALYGASGTTGAGLSSLLVNSIA